MANRIVTFLGIVHMGRAWGYGRFSLEQWQQIEGILRRLGRQFDI